MFSAAGRNPTVSGPLSPLAVPLLKKPLGRPVAATPEAIEYAQLLKAQGLSIGQIAAKTGIPKTSLHRYLTPEAAP